MTSPLVSGFSFPVFASLYCNVATFKHHCLKIDNWTEEVEEKLIELWKQHECLYNISCKAYSDRAKKRSALERIAQEMNIVCYYVTQLPTR